MKKNVPRSSRIHRLVYAFSCEHKKLLSDQVRYLYLTQVKTKSKCVQEASRRRRKQMAASKSYTFHFKNSKKKYSEAATYKNLNHIMNCCKFNLSRDIEKNPGPTFIDPSKTIQAPYCQGNVDVFGPNAGRQCVGMSLCSLIYNYSNESITDSGDLIQIMNIGNELYSVLCRLLRQPYLLLTELPTVVTVLNINYQLEFSESCTPVIFMRATLNENIPYVVALALCFTKFNTRKLYFIYVNDQM